MSKLILIVLGIAVLIVLARDPQGMGHLAEAVFRIAAKLLSAIATILNNLLGGQAH